MIRDRSIHCALVAGLLALGGSCATGTDAPAPPSNGAGGTAGEGGSGTGGEVVGGSGGGGADVGGGGAPIDNDGDGYSPPADCNDRDPAIHPTAREQPCDGADNDCDGSVDVLAYTTLFFVSYDQAATTFTLHRSDLDGQNVVPLESGIPQTTFVRMDPTDGDLYLSTVSSGLLRLDPDTGLSTVHAHIADGQGIGLDACGRTAYWGQYHGGLYAVDLDSSAAAVEIVSKAELPVGAEGVGSVELDVATDTLYFLSIDDNWGTQTKMWSAATDGAALTELGPDHPHHCLALDPSAQKLYFTRANSESGPRIMARANLDGTAVEELFTLPSDRTCGGLALDPQAGTMYIGLMVLLDPTNTAELWRMNLDGSDQEPLPVPANSYTVTLGTE